MEDLEVTINVTIAESRIILAGLAKLPLENSYNLFNKIDKSVGEQMQAAMAEPQATLPEEIQEGSE